MRSCGRWKADNSPGYAGDVWFPQPAPRGPSLADDAAPRHDAAHFGYQPVVRRRVTPPEPAKSWNARFESRPIREQYLIVEGGKLAGAGAHSYSPQAMRRARKKLLGSRKA